MSDLNVDPVTPPVPGDTGIPAIQPAIPAAPAVSTATPTGTPASATPSAPEGYVPSYRLREAREAAVRQAQEVHGRELQQIRAEAERYKQQVQALTGATPPPDPRISGVRQEFAQLYPGLSRIEERAEEIMAVLERAGDLETQNSHYWTSYGRQTMDRLFNHAAESLGGPLPDEAKRALHASFVGFVQSSPELTERYSTDPSLVEDFWKAFSSSFIDPVRRAATTTAVGRAATNIGIPQDTPGGAPRATPAPQPADLNERANNAWAMYQSSANKNIR